MEIFLIVAPAIVLLAATIKAGPIVWAFISAAARLPQMTEHIWAEFGRNGGSSTRDRIEQIARGIDRVEKKANSSIAMAEETKESMKVHLTTDATSFALVSNSTERVAARLDKMDERLGRLEESLVHGTRLEGDHAEEAKADLDARKDNHEQVDARLRSMGT